jgi:hypothetical protein
MDGGGAATVIYRKVLSLASTKENMRNLLSIQLSAGGGKQVFSKHNQ